MRCVGIGSPGILSKARLIVKGLNEMSMDKLREME